MPRVLISRCGRCGKTRSAKGWFINDHGEHCHTCKDGIIGGMVDVEPDAPIALPKRAVRFDPLLHCPICGIPWSKSNRQKARGYAGDDIHLPGGYRYCASCCIVDTSTRGNNEQKRVDYRLLDIHDFYPPSNAGEVERRGELARLARHLAWVRSLSGVKIEAESVAKAVAFSETAYKKLTGDVRHARSVLKIPCGDQGEHGYPNDEMAVSTGPYRVAVRNSSRLAVTASLRLRCNTCGRNDYYLKRELSGCQTKWIWFYTRLRDKEGQRAACEGGKALSKGEKAAARPIVSSVANGPTGTVPAGQGFAAEIDEIAKKLSKILSNQ